MLEPQKPHTLHFNCSCLLHLTPSFFPCRNCCLTPQLVNGSTELGSKNQVHRLRSVLHALIIQLSSRCDVSIHELATTPVRSLSSSASFGRPLLASIFSGLLEGLFDTRIDHAFLCSLLILTNGPFLSLHERQLPLLLCCSPNVVESLSDSAGYTE